jgi:hypothetical protein
MPFVIPSTPVTGTGTPGHQFSDITLNDADGVPSPCTAPTAGTSTPPPA